MLYCILCTRPVSHGVYSSVWEERQSLEDQESGNLWVWKGNDSHRYDYGKGTQRKRCSPGDWGWRCCTKAEGWSLLEVSCAQCADLWAPGGAKSGEKDPFWHVFPGQRRLLSGLEMAISEWTGPALKAGKMLNLSGPFFLFPSGELIPETADSILKYRLHNEPYLSLWRKTFLVLREQCWRDKRVITLRQTTI